MRLRLLILGLLFLQGHLYGQGDIRIISPDGNIVLLDKFKI